MKNNKLILIFLLIVFCVLFLIYWYLSPNNEKNTANKNDSSQTSQNDHFNQNMANKPITQPDIQSVKFDPNAKWKDKVLNFKGKNLEFRFGEGNPPETALSPEEYLAKGENDGLPYVTPDTEKKLYDFLTDEDLPEVLDKCENYNRKEMVKLNPNVPQSQLPILLSPKDFDIENILVIDKETGRKEIDQTIVNQMNEFFNLLNNPLTGSEFSDKCIGPAYNNSIKRIQNKFSDFTKSYINTGEGLSGDVWRQ